MRFPQFALSRFHAPSDFGFIILGAGAHACNKAVMINHNEHGRHVASQQRVLASRLAEALHALHIDAHDQIAACRERLKDAGFQRAVTAFTVDPCPLEELARCDLLIELLRRKKMIVNAVDFPRAWITRGSSDHATKRRILGDETVAERAFP